MRTVLSWADSIPARDDSTSNVVWDVACSPDGSQIVVAVGNRVLVYDAVDGDLLHSLRGHKENVYCVSYSSDGKRFASGGMDCSIIIWTNKADGILKYSHKDPIQCLAYNPVTQQLASGTNSDFGLWSPEQKSVAKHKVAAKVLCMSWTTDGQYLALGMFNGQVSIRDKQGAEKAVITRDAPIWCCEWNPSKSEAYDILAVGCWDQTLSFYQVSGLQQGKDRPLGFDPCSLSFFSSGDFLVVGGSDKKVSLWTKDGIFLGPVAEREDWVWACKVRPKQNFVVVGSNDGSLCVYQIVFNTVHGLYQDRYAYRELMTDVIIQHLASDQKRRIKCREHVKKIAVYKDRLAVQLKDRIVIYEVSAEDAFDMQYKVKERINKKFECSLLVVTSLHIILCQEKRLQLYNFLGNLEREWVLDSPIRYIKVVGGPIGREGLLVGLKSGQILKIFIDNPFPITLIKQPSAVRCLDLSLSRNKLAVVDENSNLLVYDLSTKEMLFQEPNANSVAWNSEMEDMLAFSGNGLLGIKTGSFPTVTQKLQGFVVGFKGSKIFCLHYVAMQTIDVPQSASMQRYIEKKDFETAFKVACLGVTENDWRMLAMEALQQMDFAVARKAFIRIKDLRFIDLLARIEQERKLGVSDIILQADVLAFQSKYQEAAKMYTKGGQPERAVEMFTDLRQWEDAKTWAIKLEKDKAKGATGSAAAAASKEKAADSSPMASSGPSGAGNLSKALILKQAQWSLDVGDWKTAAEMYKASEEYRRAIEIYASKNMAEPLADIVRIISKHDRESLGICASVFRRTGHHQYAKEAYIKMGDINSLLGLHIELQKWEEAFALAEQHPHLHKDINLPYADWLASQDRFDEAQQAYWRAGRPELSLRMLEQLTHNAVVERRFQDAALYFWQLAQEHLRLVQLVAPDEGAKSPQNMAQARQQQEKLVQRYQDLKRRAEIYYGFDIIRKFVEEPFTDLRKEVVFNVARFLLNAMSKETPHGVSRVYVLFALAKTSKALGAYKLARYAFERLSFLRVPREWQEQIDMASLAIRSKPFSDREEVLPVCNRCMATISIVNPSGDFCSTCMHPLSRSFISFEVLPLVEFVPDDDISHEEAVKLINSEAPGGRRNGGWSEYRDGGAEALRLDDNPDDVDDDPFLQVLEATQFQPGEPYEPLRLDRARLQSLLSNEVFIVSSKEFEHLIPPRYFRLMIPDVQLVLCKKCNHFFHQEDFELAVLQKNACPFCRTKEAEAIQQ